MVENVLLLTIDSLRADYVPDREDGSSTIAAVASTGVRFSSAFATGSGTGPSFPGILTGTLPLSFGGLGPLNRERPRMSSNLHNAGLSTGGFQTNPFLSAHFNYDVGFGRFEDYQNPLMGLATRLFPRGIESDGSKLSFFGGSIDLASALKSTYEYFRGKPRPYVSAEVISEDTIAWLRETDTPFFCWSHFMDVHHPCFPPEEYRHKYGIEDVTHSEVAEWYNQFSTSPETLSQAEVETMRDLYRSAIEYVDDQIGTIVNHLRETNRFDETLLIITSDHGELFGEHDQYGKPDRMYDELLKVPLLVANGPNWLSDATDQLVSLLDLPPLIHAALGVDPCPAYRGRVPGQDPARQYIQAEMEYQGEPIVGVRSRNWLYEADEISGEHRTYRIDSETPSRISPHSVESEELEALKDAAVKRLAELDISDRQLRDEVDGDMESRLEDLGYL
ncbi:sulfatase-like hydrolase/transferase [Halomicroarcula limicola]|uniref:Sulfatase-like hydrolase/transferase n=1 Tax=Haloarcula limicola TaxID=1429915 RepID=A0A8J8C5H4_9EURY|nr:sulfatase [Halomicroarcula limicola]MBV0925214.1 sulfatase-like hydrolase/transferase [Halomicroarcula limicola]